MKFAAGITGAIALAAWVGCTPRAGAGTGAEAGTVSGSGTGTGTGTDSGERANTAREKSACRSDADCRAFSDYCGGCNCRALARGEPEPACDGPRVMCYVDPCHARTAACDAATHACVLR